MKKILIAITMMGPIFCQQPSTILSNGWLGGLTVPANCSSGTSPAFYRYGDQSIWDCVGNNYASRLNEALRLNTSPLGQGSYNYIWLNPIWTVSGTPNVNGYYGLAVTTEPTDTASGNIVGIYSAIQSGSYSSGIYDHTNIWAENLVANWRAGDPDVNVQISEMDLNNLQGNTFAYLKEGLNIENGYIYNGGTGLRVDSNVQGITGYWRNGIAVQWFSDVGILLGGAFPGAYYASSTEPIDLLIQQDHDLSDGIDIRRFTDTSPSGYYLRFLNAAETVNVALWHNSGDLDWNVGTLTSYNGVQSGGQGLSSVVGYASNQNVSSSVTLTPVNTGTLLTGFYKLCLYSSTVTAGTGNITVSPSWMDSIGIKNPTVFTMALTSGNLQQACIPVQLSGSTINYATSYTGTGAYNIYASLERMQ